MSVLTTTPKFLYPHSRQFPFDEVAEKIVKAIEKRNWNVPGITIEFDTYGSGEEKYQMVCSITGKNFRLYFCRIQGHLSNRWNDTAALTKICIPKQILEVYNDESGPTYYLYVGKDWEADKDWFMNSIKVHSKLNGEPRRYLTYSGKRYYQGIRAKELVADDDMGREYSPEGNEPVELNLQRKFRKFTAWLKEFVLDYILSFPEADTIQPPVPMEELIPYEGPWETIFSICDQEDAERILQGKEDPSELEPSDRNANIGTGTRLVPLDVKCEGKFPKIAHEGFIWCDTDQKEDITKETKFARGVMTAMYSLFMSNYAVAIKLKYANHVYVADDAKFEETRQQFFRDIAPRTRLTDAEVGMAHAARGATIVPITEYKGGYKKPIVLINRELEFEEIDWISKIE